MFLDNEVLSDCRIYPSRVITWFVRCQYAKVRYHLPLISDEAMRTLVNMLHERWEHLKHPLKGCVYTYTSDKLTYYALTEGKVPAVMISSSIFNISKVYSLSGDQIQKMRRENKELNQQESKEEAKSKTPVEYVAYVELPPNGPVDNMGVHNIVNSFRGRVMYNQQGEITGVFPTRKEAVYYLYRLVNTLTEYGYKPRRYRLLDTLIDSKVFDIYEALENKA